METMTDALRWKVFCNFWRVLTNTIERINAYAEEMRRFPMRPTCEIVAKLNTKCAACGQVTRMGEKICYAPAHNGMRPIVFHWPCAPRYSHGTAEEIAAAMTLLSMGGK